MTVPRPTRRPSRPHFGSGPCAKRPGWDPAGLDTALLGRSHRSATGAAALAAVIDRSRELLGLPDGWRLGIVPASDTGAVEIALWSLLGARPVDVLVWDAFGQAWANDITEQLRLADARVLAAPFGELPDLGQVNPDHDVVFTWNGTTSGVCVPGATWLAGDRGGLAICDATSAVFAMPVPVERLDVLTWSWQKVLGGEGAHGMLGLSPRAVERLESHTPPWPLPKLFRLTKGGRLIEGIFRGETINTPSMLAVADVLDALDWAERIGGIDALMARSRASLALVSEWVSASPWARFLAVDPATRSCTSITIAIAADWFKALSEAGQRAAVRRMVTLLEAEGVAWDIAGYRSAPPGLRIWAGATVEPDDVAVLLPWLDWAFAQVAAAPLAQPD